MFLLTEDGRNKLRVKAPPWSQPLLRPCRYKGAKSGRGAGKSHFFAEKLVSKAARNPDWPFICLREVQKSIKLSSKRLIESKINSLGVSHLFDVQRDQIYHKGGEGLIAFQGLQDHTADSIKSLEGFKVAWVEEAQSISERSLRLLRPTMRSGSELWFSWNAEFPEDPVEELFADADSDDDMELVSISWRDNPYFPEELIKEMERDRRIYSDQMWRHVWEGEYITSDMGEVFKWQWFREYDKLPEGKPDMVVHSWDTAYKKDAHNDPSACTVWYIFGTNAYLVHVFNEKMEYPELKKRIRFMHLQYPADIILIEDKASGQSLIQEFRETGELPVTAIMPEGDKVSRASSSTDIIESGHVYRPARATWLSMYKKQLARFSFSKELQKKQNDDMVDSTSQFLNWWKSQGMGNWAAQMKRIYGQ